MKRKPITLLILFLCFLAAATVLFRLLFENNPSASVLQVLSITFLTVFYHFAMRLAVGETVTLICRNRTFCYDAFWFRPKKFEKKLYRFLRVKRWKKKLITAKPEQFDLQINTPEQLLFYMTQAEIVHECIMVLSFVPLLFIPVFGAPAVFIVTSVLACLIDAVFVMIQRYNRPRLQKLLR